MNAPIRNLCPRCLRPQKVCFCAEIRAFEHPVEFVILNHPREQRRGTGTGRMTHLCLENSQLLRGYSFSDNPRFRSILEDPSRQAWVLYPGERATVVSDETRESLRASFADRPATVFVVDATWAQAKKMFRVTPELQSLPWIAFDTDRRSEYQFRLQPDPLCLATVEAVHELIDALDRHRVCHPSSPGAHHNLIDVFRSLNETQLRCANDPVASGYRRTPPRELESIPAAKKWRKRPLLFRPQG